jgi:NAD(P)-binding Rossmann-like domain
LLVQLIGLLIAFGQTETSDMERIIVQDSQTVIIGAGIGGLVSAVLLASRGMAVTVVEKENGPGGKVRQLDVGGAMIDAGPTVFTMRAVIDEIFEAAGARTEDYISLHRSDRIARHAWGPDERLDLYADHERSVDAIGEFAGTEAAAGFRKFSKEAKRLHDALDRPFLRGSKTDPLTLGWRMGLRGLPDWMTLRAYTSLWSALGKYFPDPRLRQLFGRYTTYCGSSPFQTPATLMLIAHVEAQGVWAIEGGVSALAYARCFAMGNPFRGSLFEIRQQPALNWRVVSGCLQARSSSTATPLRWHRVCLATMRLPLRARCPRKHARFRQWFGWRTPRLRALTSTITTSFSARITQQNSARLKAAARHRTPQPMSVHSTGRPASLPARSACKSS